MGPELVPLTPVPPPLFSPRTPLSLELEETPRTPLTPSPSTPSLAGSTLGPPTWVTPGGDASTRVMLWPLTPTPVFDEPTTPALETLVPRRGASGNAFPPLDTISGVG